MSIEKLLNKERELHKLLNMKDCPVNINEQFTALFNDPLMLNSTLNKLISFYYYNGGRHKDNVLTCSYKEISVDPGIRCSYDCTSSSFGL